MSLLEAKNLTKSFFGITVLKGLDLTLEPGRIIGLVGENGSGKSTSMNILGGVLQPDAGSMTLDGSPYVPKHPRDAYRAGVNFIHQELNLFPNLTIEENLYLGGFPSWHPFIPIINRRRIRVKTNALLDEVSLEVSPVREVASLSQGEKQLVEIAKALSGHARLIIFDEPTTSLTAHEIERLFALIAKFRSQGIAMIYISHIIEDVLRLCDEIVVLRDGLTVGRDSATRLTPERIITLMVGRTIEQMFPTRDARPGNKPLLEILNVSEPGVVKNISISIHPGEVVGLAGMLGSGRSELAQIVFGLAPKQSGRIVAEGRELDNSAREAIQSGLAFLTEDRRSEGLLGLASIGDNVALPALEFFSRKSGVVDTPRLRSAISAVANSVQLRASNLERQTVNSLSGGNQQKVVLAKWLMRSPKIFILDEPTRGIDVGAKYEIYKIINRLAAGGAAILLISSEIEELIGLSDRIIVMSRGEISAEFSKDQFDREQILRAAMKKAD